MNMIDEFHEISDLAELAAVISVVDATHFRDNLAASGVTTEQIRAADTVILNKCDLVTNAERTEIKRRSTASIRWRALSRQSMAGSNPPSSAKACATAKTKQSPSAIAPDTSTSIGVTHSDEGFCVAFFPCASNRPRPPDAHPAGQSPDVLRIKGVALLTDSDGPQVIQYIPGHVDFEPVLRAAADAPFCSDYRAGPRRCGDKTAVAPTA